MAYRSFLASFALLLGETCSVFAQPGLTSSKSSEAAAESSPLAITPAVISAYGDPSPPSQPVNSPAVPTLPDMPFNPGASGTPLMPAFPIDQAAFGYPDSPLPSPSLDYYGVVRPPIVVNDPRVYLGANLLLWWMKPTPAAPLITASLPGDQAILGNPSTVVMFGDREKELGPFDGGRAQVDWWITENFGIEGVGILFEQRAQTETFISDTMGNPTIGIPFVDANTGLGNAVVLATNGVSAGGVEVRQTLRLFGLEANFLTQDGFHQGDFHFRTLFGGRYAELRETLGIDTSTTFLFNNIGTFGGVPLPAQSMVNGNDSFATRNTFTGGQVGFEAIWGSTNLFLTLRGTFATGSTHQNATIAGSSTLTLPNGLTVTLPGNLLALSTNSGRTTLDELSVLPEASLSVTVNLGDHLHLHGGYSFMYWSNIVRPGDQVDRVINATLVPLLTPGVPAGAAQPRVIMNRTDFWAQGANAGLTLMW